MPNNQFPNCLRLFAPNTALWFQETLGAPTPVQEAAWPAIAAGSHVLVSAPTGTGKTLSAFLVFLDRLKERADKGALKQELYLIYVSPLKSLAADIRENLHRPLAGIDAESCVQVAIRTGDTTPAERRQMIRKPPHILITTPESLYLLLTAKTGQNMLCTAKAVIIDELHALIDTKRGAHLMFSLARLDMLCGAPLQRIGLSATIAPLSLAAEYLAPEPVFIAAPSMEKKIRLQILGSYVDTSKRRHDPVWQELSELVYQYCQGAGSVIAFVEGRRYAEKLAYYVNQIGGEDFARVHHGSLSKEQRTQTELALREGRLRLLCATSSMELGIDVGEIGQVLQVGCPRTVSSTMQRLGRAGHNPGLTSVMYLFPRTAAESVLCGMTAQMAREGLVEKTNPPQGCLDILAQHLVSMAAFKGYEVDDVMRLLPRAWPFRDVTREDVESVLRMLSGDYEHRRDIPVRPRILYDRLHGHVEGDGYSRILAVSAGGTIPDKGLYTVRTEAGVKVGEADEEFIYETRIGDRFILGAFAWKVLRIGRDTVTVTQTHTEGARLPFWKGEIKGRSKETGEHFGRILRGLEQASGDGRLNDALAALGLDESAAVLAGEYLKRQIAVTDTLPSDKTILAEHFKDQSGNSQLMIHSVFGRRVNAPLSLLAAQAAGEEMGTEIGSVDEEDGFLLYSYDAQTMPEGLLARIDPASLGRILRALLPSVPVFNMAFRYSCGRALMMGAKGSGRHPLWMQRLRSAEMLEQVVRDIDHPLIRETTRECMEQFWDLQGLIEVLEQIRCGEIIVREVYTDTASPMSLPLQWSQEAAMMYDYAPTPRSIHAAVEEALQREKELLLPGSKELAELQERGSLPEDEKQLHSLLMTEGDLTAGDLEIPVEWLETLHKEGRVLYLEQGLWIAAEQQEDYRKALEDLDEEACLSILRRMLRYRGGARARQAAERYGFRPERAEALLQELCRRGEAVCHREPAPADPSNPVRKAGINPEPGNDTDQTYEKGTAGIPSNAVYYHAQLYKRARTKTLKNRREEISTCPPASYASLLLSRTSRTAPAQEALSHALLSLSGTSFPAAAWEDQILPLRVKGYRENLLDSLLAKGEFFWHMEEGRIRFDRTDDIDWESTPAACLRLSEDTQAKDNLLSTEALSEKERLILEALSRRGASFLQALGNVLPGELPYDTLLSLMEKGLVCADSFLPVRQWKNREKIKKSAARQRIGARVKALNAGRWDLVRPLRPLNIQEQMDRCFDRYLILCRETAASCGLSWQEALSLLRVQEYTGQVRRGYFVEGFSGAQFIRKEDFGGITARLLHPTTELLWINAADPMQPWGKLLPHHQERSFANLSGAAVALRGGLPVILFEKQGKGLRIFDSSCLQEALQLFTKEYRLGRIFPDRKRIVVKEYPAEAADALAQNGFMKEMLDYTLYR
ncbi:MAG: DEAD/DEAH box helicase [Lachnospiraceae bacterium]